MVIREHLDISLQVAAMDRTMAVEPKSVVHFDNLGTRMTLPDMRFFFYRWGRKLTTPSSRLFERRWGYNFYSEQSMYNWVVRRSEEHTSELQSLMRISYAVFCLKKKKNKLHQHKTSND